VTLIDADGRPRAGWPFALPGWWCGDGGWYWPCPVTAADGSVRVVCQPNTRPGGRPLVGWPVELPTLAAGSQLSVLGDSFVVLAQETGEWDQTARQASGSWWLIHVAADGTLHEGPPHLVPDAEGYGFPELGLAGTAYQLAYPDKRTEIRTLAVDADGPVSTVATGAVPTQTLGTWSGAGPGEPAVVAAADGATWVLSEPDGPATVFPFDPLGRARTGWPYRPAAGLQWRGSCGSGLDTGCGVELFRPAVGQGHILFLPVAAHFTPTGGSLVAIGPDGRIRPGWPVVLTHPGAEFWSVVVGRDGTAYALAIEPDASATILAIPADGTVRYRTTVVEP
jgi:hypothetical protein